MARRGVLASLARAWCLPLAFSRDRRLLALLRQAILFALVFWVARSWATEKPASVRHAPRSFPEDLTRLAAPVLTVRTLEQDAREHGARWPPRRSPQRRVLFMTYEIAGPHMNGGIGTAFRNLAASLAARGHNVSVVVVTGPRSNPNSGRTWEQWVEYFKSEHGISLTAFEEHPKAWDVIRHSFDLKKARQAYNWLLPRQNDFDIVHFHEWRGLSYFIMGSKRLGLAFQNTLLVTGTHGPDLWAHMASLKVAPNKTIEPAFLERKAVELADLVVSPSRYMLEWMNQQRWPLAPRLAVSENVLSPSFLSTAIRRNDVVKAKEFAFFGRLEARKGFAIFKEAMLELQKKHPAVRVTLIGKSESEALIAGLPSEWSLHTNFSIEVAHEYLRQPGRVAVVPSLIDNSPYTILECLAIGIPLIASDAGGNGELFAPEFRKTNMFRPSKGELLRIAKVAVERGIPIARPSTEPGQLQEAWGLWHDAVPVTPAISKKGKVAVVAATVEGVTPEHAVRWLEEALGQWKGETILVHRNKWTFAKPSGWKLVRVDDSLAKMWTKGASLVRADAVLFVDLVSRPKLDIALLEGAFGIADNRVVVIPSYAQGNDSWAFDATAPQAGGASTLAMDDGVRKGRSIAVRKAVLEQTGGFDLGRYPCEAVTNFLINLDVARIPVLVLPDPVPASSGQNPSLKDVEGEKMIVYNALVRYFPQDTGMALVVADRMAGREARTVAESRKDFSLHQGVKSWSYGYRIHDPSTGKTGNFTPLKNARKLCWNAWDCEERHDDGEKAEYGTIFIGDRKQHPMVYYPPGKSVQALYAIRRWTAREEGRKAVYVFVKRVPGSMCGDGVVIRLVVDGQLAYERAMPLGLEDKTLQDDVAEFEVEVPMDIGSTLELQVDPRKSHDCDGMLVDLKIMNVADQGSIDEI